MITRITLCLRHQGRVENLKNVSFIPGINVVVGPNGSGKSTLLKSIYDCADCRRYEDVKTTYRYFNAEIMNPHRCQKPFTGVSGSLIKVRSRYSSHGETMRDVLGFFRFQEGDCLLFDEPEAGQDLEWITRIRKGLEEIKKDGCQIIIASHHPVFWKKANIIELRRGYIKKSLAHYNKIVSKR